MSNSTSFAGAVLVPGMPQLLDPQPPPAWAELADSARVAGERLSAAGAEALVVISTQWFTVLGHQVQVDERLSGTRVDENWYDFDYGTMHYDISTDVEFAERWATEIEAVGLEARRTKYEHFPVDTGVILADTLLNARHRLPLAQVSCNLYASVEDITTLGKAAIRAADAVGRRIGLVAVSGLSSALTQRWIEPHEDRVEEPAYEQWDRRILGLLEAGDLDQVMELREEYARTAQADSQLRALAFLQGSGQLTAPADVLAYGPLWGTGGAVIHWPG